ncbi:Four helix bundle sensory module for signal transduction [Formivibrio citricus]|uniref:Chemotaxis protein CheA n=1 Tax=Formivibrio citricus TaxID=83765 RepID=A0A1I4VVN0_9NEIS|nr:HAMP domain-containing protein [Formivibrio citricus]SFN05066.1 Four helix bundle sensory module for signal transduction [Formivibrio citricus]
MSLRHRIVFLVALTFVAIAAIGGYSVIQSRKNASNVKTVTEGVVPSALASADLVALLKEVQLATMTLASAPDQTLAEEAREKLAAQKTQLKDGLDLQFKQATGQAQQGLIEQTRESLDNYFAAIDEMAQLKLAGQTDLAQAVLFASVAQYKREMEQVIDTLRIEKNRSKDEAITALNENLAGAVSALSMATVLAIVALGAAGTLLYRQIVRPVGTMQSLMTEIATSQDFTRRLPVERMDEIGQSTVAFNAMIEKIQESSEQLKQKTTDIQTMLQNIPQGILTIADGNKVHPEYSAYLETIFETRDIAGRDMMALVFADTNLGADALAQVEAAAGACIGEDCMNFEFNQHLLAGEVEKRMPDGRVKILDLNWSPITNDADTIVRLMLCVRDVTELRKLAAEANEKKQELEIIGEILAVSQEKFHDFIAGALKFIDENELILHQYPEQDAQAIAQLFRNMHTIKGNARTYGLQHLTNLVHEAEQTYDELRGAHPDIAWDQGLLLEELAGVRDAVERYARINEVSLGRKGPGRRGSVERYLMVDKEQIQQTIHRLETVNTGNLHELVAARDAVRKTLRLLGTEPLGKALAGILASLPSLAKELGKRPPMIRIEDHGYVLRNQISGVIKNVFMHLLRNSLDHGLESKEERLAQGKSKAGLIDLEMNVADGQLQIRLSDDGRGLALARIRKTAIQKGLIRADEHLGDEDIARLIFRPGFSTAEKVSEISGRGVGMDAVQDFVKREHGKIEIRFLDNAIGADFRRFETVVLLPESSALYVEGRETLYVYDLREMAKEAEASEADVAGSPVAGKPQLRVV